jgi:hypothetical protein
MSILRMGFVILALLWGLLWRFMQLLWSLQRMFRGRRVLLYQELQ